MSFDLINYSICGCKYSILFYSILDLSVCQEAFQPHFMLLQAHLQNLHANTRQFKQPQLPELSTWDLEPNFSAFLTSAIGGEYLFLRKRKLSRRFCHPWTARRSRWALPVAKPRDESRTRFIYAPIYATCFCWFVLLQFAINLPAGRVYLCRWVVV